MGRQFWIYFFFFLLVEIVIVGRVWLSYNTPSRRRRRARRRNRRLQDKAHQKLMEQRHRGR